MVGAFNLDLPIMLSVPFTANVLFSIPAHGSVYLIRCYVNKFFVSYLEEISGFLRLFNFIGVMVSVFASSAVDRGFEPFSGQTKDY